MNKLTFTIFDAADKVYGYLFDKTRKEAQDAVNVINAETGKFHYYMEGYYEDEK